MFRFGRVSAEAVKRDPGVRRARCPPPIHRRTCDWGTATVDRPWTTRSASTSTVSETPCKRGTALGGLSTLRPRRRSPSNEGAVGEGWATPFEAPDRGKETATAPVPGHRVPGCRRWVGFRRLHAAQRRSRVRSAPDAALAGRWGAHLGGDALRSGYSPASTRVVCVSSPVRSVYPGIGARDAWLRRLSRSARRWFTLSFMHSSRTVRSIWCRAIGPIWSPIVFAERDR